MRWIIIIAVVAFVLWLIFRKKNGGDSQAITRSDTHTEYESAGSDRDYDRESGGGEGGDGEGGDGEGGRD